MYLYHRRRVLIGWASGRITDGLDLSLHALLLSLSLEDTLPIVLWFGSDYLAFIQ